ncbi:unnamed protein product [Phytophthora fragariaefolia]|uniref:Unnamed protein product n=1 Tax=Phytophthora fragariaefolia TaxID=1490495 RepID=A0A9W7CUV5_9STRA|nr:unnamed protein product [Phytophthora fragariaefolia]
MYYNPRNVRHGTVFRIGQLVWSYGPTRGPGITKFGNRWRGPGQIMEAAGYDNYLVKMLESDRETWIYVMKPVAAADIDPEEEVREAQFEGLTGIAPVVTENNAVDNGNDTPITAAAPVDAAAVENQQSVQDLDTSSGISIAEPKRRRGQPRKDVPPVTGDNQRAAAGITDQHDATEARRDQRTAADESSADVRPTKRRRTKVVAAAPTDAIARRTRMQMQRDHRTDADRSKDRDQIDDADRAPSQSRVSFIADHESAATRRPSSPEVSRSFNSATAQEIATPRGDAEPVKKRTHDSQTSRSCRLRHLDRLRQPLKKMLRCTSSPARDGEELTASFRPSRDLIAYDQMRP